MLPRGVSLPVGLLERQMGTIPKRLIKRSDYQGTSSYVAPGHDDSGDGGGGGECDIHLPIAPRSY